MSKAKTRVFFVICEVDNQANPIENILTHYDPDQHCFHFVDGMEFNPDQILKFESYDSANLVVQLAYSLPCPVYLGIAIYEDGDDFADFMYVRMGRTKNLEVQSNRQKSFC